jgi:Protein of unknown function (DUF3551)
MQKGRAKLKRPLTLGAAAISCAAFFGAAGPAAAKNEYCRRGVSDYRLSCGFDTLAQWQAMSSGRGGDCVRDPFIAGAANAYAYAPIARKHRQK